MTAARSRRNRWRALPVVALLAAGCGSSTTGSGGSATEAPSSVPSGTRVLVALALSTDAAGLAGLVQQTADARSPEYHHFIDLPTVAQRFGASPQTAEAAVERLASLGVTVSADPSGGALWGEVDASTAERVFGVHLQVVDSGGDQVIVPDRSPSLPSGLDGVTGVIGLSGTLAHGPSSPPSGEPGCPADGQAMSAARLADTYGFTTLTGDDGAGTSVALFSVGSYDPAVGQTYATCTGTALQGGDVSTHVVPLAPPAPPGTEAALDTLILQMIAPRASVTVTRIDDEASIVFPVLDLMSQASSPEALVFTLGYCESALGAPELALSEWLLAALAATGTTTIAATGDTGSSACHPGSDGPAVQYPASSAYAVGVGGAQYDGSAVQPVGLAAWNDGQGNAGGGGASVGIAAPPFQSRSGTSTRTVPDISADAVADDIGLVPVCGSSGTCDWVGVGGTSAGAAVLGAAGLVYSSRRSTDGSPERWGLLAPALYDAAGQHSRLPDIVTGDNETYSEACCTAGPGYDEATGIGLLSPDVFFSGVS